MSYKSRLELYQQIKKEIERTARTSAEYEKRVRALAQKLKI